MKSFPYLPWFQFVISLHSYCKDGLIFCTADIPVGTNVMDYLFFSGCCQHICFSAWSRLPRTCYIGTVSSSGNTNQFYCLFHFCFILVISETGFWYFLRLVLHYDQHLRQICHQMLLPWHVRYGTKWTSHVSCYLISQHLLRIYVFEET